MNIKTKIKNNDFRNGDVIHQKIFEYHGNGNVVDADYYYLWHEDLHKDIMEFIDRQYVSDSYRHLIDYPGFDRIIKSTEHFGDLYDMPNISINLVYNIYDIDNINDYIDLVLPTTDFDKRFSFVKQYVKDYFNKYEQVILFTKSGKNKDR